MCGKCARVSVHKLQQRNVVCWWRISNDVNDILTNYQIRFSSSVKNHGGEKRISGKLSKWNDGMQNFHMLNVQEEEEDDDDEELEDELLDCLMCRNETLVDFLRKHIKFHHMIQVFNV